MKHFIYDKRIKITLYIYDRIEFVLPSLNIIKRLSFVKILNTQNKLITYLRDFWIKFSLEDQLVFYYNTIIIWSIISKFPDHYVKTIEESGKYNFINKLIDSLINAHHSCMKF